MGGAEDEELSVEMREAAAFRFPAEIRLQGHQDVVETIPASERPDADRNFRQALTEVLERHPQLEIPIRRSLETPQMGEYHNEGERMDAHLSLIISTLNDIKAGKFPGELDPAIQSLLQEVVLVKDKKTGETIVNPDMVDFAFLHDIAKPDSLAVKVEGEKSGIEITWEQWQEIEKQGKPYRIITPDSRVAAITSISYYHQSEGEAGQHGNKGARFLEKREGVSPTVLTAIDKHEVAYLFVKINAATYEEHFVSPGYSNERQKWIVAASYIDTMASLRSDGKPDLANFLNLVSSRDNYLLIQEVLGTGAKIRENDLQALKKRPEKLSREQIEAKIAKEKKYNLEMLGVELGKLVEQQQLTEGEKQEVIGVITTDPNSLGRKMGLKMKLLKPILQMCEVV